jgi:hypothetical protein
MNKKITVYIILLQSTKISLLGYSKFTSLFNFSFNFNLMTIFCKLSHLGHKKWEKLIVILFLKDVFFFSIKENYKCVCILQKQK